MMGENLGLLKSMTELQKSSVRHIKGVGCDLIVRVRSWDRRDLDSIPAAATDTLYDNLPVLQFPIYKVEITLPLPALSFGSMALSSVHGLSFTVYSQSCTVHSIMAL